MQTSTVSVRVGRLGVTLTLALQLLLGLTGCGGGSSSTPASGPLSGNWQLVLNQQFPRPTSKTPISVSGFLDQSKESVTGSLQVPPSAQNGKCAGVGSVTGTVSGTNVALTITSGGNELILTGVLSSDGKSITSGSYSGPGGGCFTTPTSGTWTGSLVPALTGNFKGTIDSSYMGLLLTGVYGTGATPVQVSGTMTQGGLDGTGSQATLTGTINAVGYPCFTTAAVSGTISGTSVYLLVYGFDGKQIGTIGIPSIGGGSAATVVISPLSLTGNASGGGLILGDTGNQSFGPCPPLSDSNGNRFVADAANITLNF